MSKKSAQKKRHTKPCRYFQINKCPHSADACDFAHVIATPAVPLDGALCRYYSVGRCTNGPMCRYQHAPELVRPTAAGDWARSPTDVTGPPPLYGSYPAYGQVWPSSGFPSRTTPFHPPIAESILFAPPPRSRDSIDTASNSISSLDSDEVIVVTDDPQYPEHAHSHQSQVHVAEDSPIIHVPPFYQTALHLHANSMLSPTTGAGGVFEYGFSTGMMSGGVQKPDSRLRMHPKPISKQKVLKFKTKPCKFFTTERGCPNGRSCTFLHDEDISVPPSPPMLPVKYPTLAGGSDGKTFFPVTWRVIGGGVRVGVARENEKDGSSHQYGQTIEHPVPQKHSSLPPLKLSTRQRSNSIPPTPSNAQIKVENLFSAESPGVL